MDFSSNRGFMYTDDRGRGEAKEAGGGGRREGKGANGCTGGESRGIGVGIFVKTIVRIKL